MDLVELKLNELIKENKRELIEDIKEYIQNEFAELSSKNYNSDKEDIEDNTNVACSNILRYLDRI